MFKPVNNRSDVKPVDYGAKYLLLIALISNLMILSYLCTDDGPAIIFFRLIALAVL